MGWVCSLDSFMYQLSTSPPGLMDVCTFPAVGMESSEGEDATCLGEVDAPGDTLEPQFPLCKMGGQCSLDHHRVDTKTVFVEPL